ncbi:hypothetical protein QQF64_018851 [Cirrhinus molitorella]|uniref:Gypsy retrotransposon integrase-like protein 1 n=1 Tax=Cirrhinus molitorella TaxID=172907 RepID=A0ABR3LF98_9TELE
MDVSSTNVGEQAVVSHAECSESHPYQLPPGASYREPLPVIELSSMMSDMYIDSRSQVGGSEEDEPPMLKSSGEMLEQLETKITQLSTFFQALQTEVQALKSDFITCNDSMVNREACFRDAVDQRMEALKAEVKRSMSHLETEMVNCLKRRDEHWKKEMAHMKTTSTPVSLRPLSHSLSDAGHPLSATSSLQLWETVKKPDEQLLQGSSRTFMVADGKAHVSEGRIPVDYEWHGMVWPIDTYIMSDEHLAFPLILGLDFLRQTGVQLNIATMSYELKVNGQGRVYPFLQQPQWEQPWILRREPVTSLFMAVPADNGGELETLASTTVMYVDDNSSHWNLDIPSTMEEILKAQSGDIEVSELKGRIGIMDDVNRIRWEVQQGLLYRVSPCAVGTKYQLVVPKSLTTTFINYFHNSPLGAHLGRMKTLQRILEVAWWSEVRKDVWKYVKECTVCQKYKPSNTKPYGFLQSTEVEEPGYMLGVDLMGPLPKSKKGNVYLLVVVDYYTKWVELFPIRDSKTHRICKFLQEEVFTRWGVPKFLLSDRGPQFLSQLMEDLCKRWGIMRKFNTSYHPQTNLSERVNRTIKTMMASYVGETHRDWDKWLAEFRFAINTASNETTGHSPAELALGRQLKGPLE